MWLVKYFALFLFLVFIAPALVTAIWWTLHERPASWRNADWSSSGLLPRAPQRDDAAVYVLSARTGGLKGAFALHSWIVIKKPGSPVYQRFDKVGWGAPIRRNAFAADGRWYSNMPVIVVAVSGAEAAKLIPKVEAAIADYAYSKNGDYRIWPGPNSNSFVAHVLRQVPELEATLPPNATGRDFAPGIVAFDLSPDWRDLHATIGGVIGFAIGARSGFEIHFAGLVAGLDFAHPAIKIPAFGRLNFT